jgi:C1A family cysteine protease
MNRRSFILLGLTAFSLSAKEKKFGFGWIPPKQKRIYNRAFIDVSIKKETNLRNSYLTGVEFQGDINSCVGFAAAHAYRYAVLAGRKQVKMSSPAFIYNAARLRYNLPLNIDSGAYLEDAMLSTIEKGVPPDSMWGYNLNNIHKDAPPNVYRFAAKHKSLSVFGLSNRDDCLACLSTGFPFVFGCFVFPQFISVNDTGLVEIPYMKKVPSIGTHAMLAIGHDDKYLYAQNSWGRAWGNKGYCKLPLDYCFNGNNFSNLFGSCLTIHAAY